MEDRKKDHIEMAFSSATPGESRDDRFFYEPMLSGHPADGGLDLEFAGKRMRLPFWVSSMTGGTADAGHINRNLARLCGETGMGMGLGSCRIILDDDKHFADFDLRPLIGDEQPFYANLGIAQVEQILEREAFHLVDELVWRLRADGLIIHVNPMQEWLQPEGDRFKHPPIETLRTVLDKANYPVIVKEVGQGMGPESLRHLLGLPFEAIELAAFGGTNFSRLELMRASEGDAGLYRPFAYIGHTAAEMMGFINAHIRDGLNVRSKGLIISGGINSMTDAHALLLGSRLPAIIGQASAFLRHARGDYEELLNFATAQADSLRMARAFLKPRD